jgi:pyruvate/2-oxoglutarate dehydrogenase complex dihydrolipoamide acyltransferase (E2) component
MNARREEVMTDVEIPGEIVDDGAEGAISVWLFRDGEAVVAGDVLAEVMNEKAAAELVAPASGRLTILVPAQNPVRKGQVVARIG